MKLITIDLVGILTSCRKMTSASDILEQVELKTQDLNNLTPSVVQKIFSVLTVKEISLLCTTNRKFNTICKEESLWKKKVLNDYGIEKKYGVTWRETAKRMFEVNMINMNDKWVNGQTYREILVNHPFLFTMKSDLLSLLVNNNEDAVTELTWNLQEEKIQEIANSVLGRQFTNDELDKIYHINSREIKIIEVVILTAYDQSHPFLPGTHIPGIHDEFVDYDLDEPPAEPKQYILELIDPIIYVMQFSTFSNDNLERLIHHVGRFSNDFEELIYHED